MAGLRRRTTLAFDDVADPADLSGVAALLDRGRPPALPESEIPTGPGADWILLPFRRLSPRGSRFTDETFGAYYAANALETAVVEVRFHRERFLLESGQTSAALVGGTVLQADLEASLVDIRGRQSEVPHLYVADAAGFGASQRWARRVHDAGAIGIVYDSVRHPGGQCVAVFRPAGLSNCQPVLRVAYEWDGTRITDVHVLQPLAFGSS